MKLQIITPEKLVKEIEISSISLPTDNGQITILPKHQPLLTHLVEGIVSYNDASSNEILAIGGGYAQTDGNDVKLLVSRAYGQSEIDEKLTQEAIASAEKIIKESSDRAEREEAKTVLRKSIIDSKLIKRKRHSL